VFSLSLRRPLDRRPSLRPPFLLCKVCLPLLRECQANEGKGRGFKRGAPLSQGITVFFPTSKVRGLQQTTTAIHIELAPRGGIPQQRLVSAAARHLRSKSAKITRRRKAEQSKREDKKTKDEARQKKKNNEGQHRRKQSTQGKELVTESKRKRNNVRKQLERAPKKSNLPLYCVSKKIQCQNTAKQYVCFCLFTQTPLVYFEAHTHTDVSADDKAGAVASNSHKSVCCVSHRAVYD
jgi:hypothetical protein